MHRALYAAMDRFPAPKGAGVHIGRMADALFRHAGGGLLYVLGDGDLPRHQREGAVEIVRHPGTEDNFLLRALAFRRRLARLLDERGAHLELCHFRDPWAGVPLLGRPGRRYRTVYEVNGLPSIELPYRFPRLGARTLAKIRAEEALCWEGADLVITPSAVLAENLVRIGAPARKIAVVPNGADLPLGRAPRPAEAPPRYLLYFGALQRWQGVEGLLRALRLLGDLPDLHLVICASSHPHRARGLARLAARLGVAERLLLRFRLSQEALAPWLLHATAAVAPLTECARNLEQGCCPLKILESMAAGVPVIASDLPVVRELLAEGRTGLLVRPDRPAELAQAVRRVLDHPEEARRLGAAAQAEVAGRLTWAHATARLLSRYEILWPAPRTSHAATEPASARP